MRSPILPKTTTAAATFILLDRIVLNEVAPLYVFASSVTVVQCQYQCRVCVCVGLWWLLLFWEKDGMTNGALQARGEGDPTTSTHIMEG